MIEDSVFACTSGGAVDDKCAKFNVSRFTDPVDGLSHWNKFATTTEKRTKTRNLGLRIQTNTDLMSQDDIELFASNTHITDVLVAVAKKTTRPVSMILLNG